MYIVLKMVYWGRESWGNFPNLGIVVMVVCFVMALCNLFMLIKHVFSAILDLIEIVERNILLLTSRASFGTLFERIRK